MIGFRVDINKEIASGHYMRCRTIASKLQNEGEDIIFIFSYRTNLMDIKADYKYKKLIAVDDKSELLEIEKIIKENNITRIYVDGYYYSESYLENLNKIVKVTYIDDLCEKAYNVDTILNYTIYADENKYKQLYKNLNVNFLLGVKYAPLRKEFLNKKYIKRTSIRNILITLGNTDNYNFTSQLLDYSVKNTSNEFTFHVVVGRLFDKLDEKKYANYNNIVFYHNVDNMAELMLSADYVITAGGTTCYEINAIGVPAVFVIVADNQIMNANKFDELGIIKCAGDIRTSKGICEKVFKLIV